MGRSASEVRAILKDEKIRFLRLVFSDIHGVAKNVEVPDRQFGKALDGEIVFDGSSIEGFVRVQESDMLLQPDLDSLRIFPTDRAEGDRIAMLMGDVVTPDGRPFAGDPRGCLRRTVAAAVDRGFDPMIGLEVEFFLFVPGAIAGGIPVTHDQGSYFDLAPADRGEEARREMVNVLEKMGFEVEAAHHEVAPGQHEIDLRHTAALGAADDFLLFKHVVKKVALRHELEATFMPKPLSGVCGSGLHTQQSLVGPGGHNAFHDPKGPRELSTVARSYIGGILRHARAACALTNPTVNSYKRLVPGFEAPTEIFWSEQNQNPLARVPDRRGASTRVEVRMPDPSCNPYLAFAALIASGLDGIALEVDPGPPVNADLGSLSARERRRSKIGSLPTDLREALDALRSDPVVLDAVSSHIATHFFAAKSREWEEYSAVVHGWERRRFIGL